MQSRFFGLMDGSGVNDEDHGIATTWRNLGQAWKYVYTGGAFVEARGLCRLFPTDRRSRPGPPRALGNSDSCVNLENKEVENIFVLPVISRVEL